MQQHVRQMMSPRPETVEFAIQHVRNRGQRMPVVGMHMREGPLHPVESKAARDPWIFVHVLVIIVVDELVPEGLAEDDPDNSHKEETNTDPLFVSAGTGPRSCVPFRSLFPPYRISHSKKE